MNVFVILTDASGGQGGIAKFNGDLLRSLCGMPEVRGIRVWARSGPGPTDAGSRVMYSRLARFGKLFYGTAFLIEMALQRVKDCAVRCDRRSDQIICGHIHFLRLAALGSWISGCPVCLILHGVEAWVNHKKIRSRFIFSRIKRVFSVSRFTEMKFREWSGPCLKDTRFGILPNCVDLERYFPGPRDETLISKYSIRPNSKIILSIGRMSQGERYKGFDELIDSFPGIIQTRPEAACVLIGSGDDNARLKRKISDLGLQTVIIFTGRVDEKEKIKWLQSADLFVMVGRGGEGFGIVYLEAMACGLPVIGSTADASAEVLHNGEWGTLANPDELDTITRSVTAHLDDKVTGRPLPPREKVKQMYSSKSFANRLQLLIGSQDA